jgi:hypothetical protein
VEQRAALGAHLAACRTRTGLDLQGAPVVTLQVRVDETGRIRVARVAPEDQARMADPGFRAFAERIIRTVLDSRCGRVPLPPELLAQGGGMLQIRFLPQVPLLRFSSSDCWHGGDADARMAVLLAVSQAADGTVRGVTVADEDLPRLSDPAFRAFAEKVLGVARDPVCFMPPSAPGGIPPQGWVLKMRFASPGAQATPEKLQNFQRSARPDTPIAVSPVPACWPRQGGQAEAASGQVMLMVRVDQTGLRRAAEVAPEDSARLADPEFLAFAERAIRVLLDPDCVRMELPLAWLRGKGGTFRVRFTL